MALPLSQLPLEILREVRSKKWLAFFVFVLVSFAVLAAGFLWPYKYQSEVVIFVDDSNIIRPLMEGSAVTTEINDRASAAREMLLGRSIMERLATDDEVFDDVDLSPEKLESRISRIRAGISVRTRGDSFFSIGFTSQSPMQAFRVSQRLGQLFIEQSKERKRDESRSAYEFIDRQVKSYEDQLAEAERRLKEFLSKNKDGTEEDANRRMANLRSQLELAELERAELNTRLSSLRDQLSQVRPTIYQGRSEDEFQERINSLQSKLDSLRLQYHDSYPDIKILQEQLAELRKQRELALAERENGGERSLEGNEIVNPLHQELSARLSATRADMETVETRIRSLKELLVEQEERMERIQENKTEYAQLTRDMEVNKGIYDDLLKRRERARVSMSLDVEGQGMNYEINETAQYPTAPVGPKFPMFAIAGLALGLVAPFGAIAGLLQVDPRVRARAQIEEEYGLPVLAEIPEVRTPYEKRKDRRVTVAIGFLSVIAIASYIAIVVASELGVL
ncbi:MAG: lipopolysaccharide biosynthesis protein [unclassified Hahellaceae]|nr:lipopolysaccharide biosynthesis protein [Hahellaceae bacterium]|tara:strand:+ start:7111 stop:8634 length:1524 start_codon:yes stop_codon:yes gene_type:complete